MKISIFQIFLSIIATTMLLSGAVKYFRRESGQTFFKVAITSLIWSGILILTLFPPASHIITAKLGFGENLNTLIFSGFVAIFLVLTKIIRVIERIEKDVSKIVREEALKELRKNK